MARSLIVPIVIAALLIAQAATPSCCSGYEVNCTGQYKGLTPSKRQLKEILKRHRTWLKEGRRLNFNDPKRANLVVRT
jgi:hypothetical protein